MGITKHMSVNIEGLLDCYKGRKMNGIISDNGQSLNDKKARKLLKEFQEKGWKYLPMVNNEDECPDFDHFEGGCPGHKVEEEQEPEKS